MNKSKIIFETKNNIRNSFFNESTGHDYFHIERVVINAKKILEKEDADEFLVELSAWVHDIGDYKLYKGIDKPEKLISEFLHSVGAENRTIDKVIEIVSEVSFSKNKKPTSIEAKIVQDADRLDAIGAIGIARCFAYGGSIGNILYNPEDKTKNSSSIQHLYDKLFHLKNLMNTNTAKIIAKKRHAYMEDFIKEFYKEVSH